MKKIHLEESVGYQNLKKEDITLKVEHILKNNPAGFNDYLTFTREKFPGFPFFF